MTQMRHPRSHGPPPSWQAGAWGGGGTGWGWRRGWWIGAGLGLGAGMVDWGGARGRARRTCIVEMMRPRCMTNWPSAAERL